MKADIIFRFLNDIAIHNDREWFREHKDEYESASVEFEKFIADLIIRISKFDNSVSSLQPHDCTYRIYRDVRFSSDKSPYKRHMGGYINPYGKKSDYAGYYIHMQPGECLICGGSAYTPSNILKILRTAVYDNIEEFISIVEDPDFKAFFPQIGFEHLKMSPKGFPKDFPYIDYLKCKDYGCCMKVSDDFFYAPDLLDRLEKITTQTKRLNDFVNYSIREIQE